jgi:hypothetical protein
VPCLPTVALAKVGAFNLPCKFLVMKRKHLFYPIIAVGVVLASCTDNDKKTEENTTADSVVTENIIDTAFATETIDTFNTTGFSTYAKQRSKQFDWSRFRMTSTWTDDSLFTVAWKPDKKYYEAYGRFLKYAPDSSYFIDLDSYNIDIRKDKTGKWIGREIGPDTEVSLINPKTGQKTRLMFMGPGNSIEDGLWLDKDNLALMGVQQYNSVKTAAVWRFNVPTKTFYLYELHDGAAAREIMGYWKKERLKGVVVKQ